MSGEGVAVEDALRRYCDQALSAASEAAETPVHERGFVLAALSNHVRECATCTMRQEARDE